VTRARTLAAATALGATLAVAACDRSADRGADRAAGGPLPPTPAGHARGESLFVAHCARCHGVAAAGTDSGPPLAHRTYEPSHHGDAAFLLAVRSGVAAHHWRFGNMPPQPQVSDAQVGAITAYVRWVQRERGIE
jgi:mono/diheme cytochrome c family protein